jgi:hypothetical protein
LVDLVLRRTALREKAQVKAKVKSKIKAKDKAEVEENLEFLGLIGFIGF